MPAKKYHVELNAQEQATLEQMLRRGKHSARRLTRARILLKASDGLRDDEIAELRSPVEAAVGRPRRYDYEYKRNATRNLFIFCEPQTGWRHVEVTERRTKQDFAHQMKWLIDERYPEAEVIRVILDNLNTHAAGSLYEAFEPAEARRLVEKLEFHYTPKHGRLTPRISGAALQ